MSCLRKRAMELPENIRLKSVPQQSLLVKKIPNPLPLARVREYGDKRALNVLLKMRDSENTADFFLKIIKVIYSEI